jgi:hypothetical protein
MGYGVEVMWIIVTGNPIDGLEHYGPFNSQEEAIGWIEHDGGDWWVTELTPVITR